MKSFKIFQSAAFVRLTLLIMVVLLSSVLHAQSTSDNNNADVQGIRNLVAQANGGDTTAIKSTDNRIFVSGAYPKPIIGKGALSAANQEAGKAVAARKNFKANYRIERLKVAQGGDMAYEFGYADISFDTPDNQHQSWEASYIRVWQKEQDSWKVAVFFIRPNKQ